MGYQFKWGDVLLSYRYLDYHFDEESTMITKWLSSLTFVTILLTSTMTLAALEDSQLPERKQSTLGLYMTAAQAYEKWKATPDKVTIIDVRTPEEYAFVGHPEMALNIPFPKTAAPLGRTKRLG